MVANNKGILAMDESNPTCNKRFAKLAIPQNEETRCAYREMIVTTPGLSDCINGAILYDETIRQTLTDGTAFIQALINAGIIPGIKVDGGAKEMAGHPGEKITEGLDGLRERLNEYSKMGIRFAKWRAVITVGDGIPSRVCIEANAHALARYAALCQEAGLVPIVEPEVLMDGGVRNGIDVVKAVALGANGVLIGRPWVFAAAAAGEKGIVDLLGVFQEEIRVAMALMGVNRIDEITADLLEDELLY